MDDGTGFSWCRRSNSKRRGWRSRPPRQRCNPSTASWRPPTRTWPRSTTTTFRFTRASLLDSVASPFVRAGRARGLPQSSLIRRHALADARIHLVTWLGLVVPSLIGGSIIIESVFGLPGLGRLFFHAVDARDYPVVMGIGFAMTTASVVGSTSADLLYQIAEPRLRGRREAR